LTAVELPGVYNPATSQPESPRYEYGYDAQGNQTLLRDPLGRETWFTFDAQNRQATRTLPLGFGDDGIRGTGDDPVGWTSTSVLPSNMPFTERMTYDALGRQKLHISFEGVVAEHVYSDTTGRLIEKRFFDNLLQYDHGAGDPSEVWTYTRDAFGRVLHVAAYLRDAVCRSPSLGNHCRAHPASEMPDHVAADLRDARAGLLEPARSETTTYDPQGCVASN